MKNIIEIIEEKLQEQKSIIFYKDMQIEELKKSLESAEKEIAALKGGKE